MELSKAAQYSKAIKENFAMFLKAEMYLLLQSPIFKIPIVGFVIRNWLSGLIDKAFESARLAIFFKFIDMRVADQQGEYTDAVLKWQEAKMKGDESEIKKTEKIMLEKFDNFIKFNRI